MDYAIFGIGTIAEKTLKRQKSKPYLVVDNNPGTWGLDFAGVNVCSPKSLMENKELKVIICTTSYKEVIKQLESYGINNFEVTSVLENVVETDRIEDIEFDLIFVSGLPSTKNMLSGGGIFRLKGTFDDYEIIKLKAGNCHGIAVNNENPEEIFVTDTSDGLIVLSRSNLEVIRTVPFDLTLRPHGICVNSNDQIFLACSYDDSVHKINGRGEDLKRYPISDSVGMSGKNLAIHHVNDLALYDGNIYVSMFSASGSWQQGFLDGAIKKVNLETGVVSTIYSDLQMPHNIQVDHSGMKFCNSLTGELCLNNRQVFFRGNGFLRGLFDCDKFMIVGESKNRNFASIKSPILNNCLDTRLNFVDKKTKAYKSIQLPPNISEIHAIMELNNV